jgi:hypothetical protein
MCYRTVRVRVLNIVLVGILLCVATIIRTFGVGRQLQGRVRPTAMNYVGEAVKAK